MSPQRYYPLFAALQDRPCLVVGGGPIAQRKVTSLLAYGARLTVVSPTLTRPLQHRAARGTIRHRARRFRPADLKGMWLVFAATDEQAINQAVYRAAARQRVFANVVDQKPLCTFILPAVARAGGLTIAVSSGGLSPTVAKRVRDDVAAQVGRRYQPLVRFLGALRPLAQQQLPTYRARQDYFEHVLADRQIPALVGRGRLREARRRAQQLLAAAGARVR